MPNIAFLSLSASRQRKALKTAEDSSGHRAFLLEKDVWVVEILRILFDSRFGSDLVFKGGTSLSKAYAAIRRFSEDVDITYDIRAFAPDLVGSAGSEALPPTRSQEQRWTKAIRKRLAAWVREEAIPEVEEKLANAGLAARLRAEGDRLYVAYDPLSTNYGFVKPEVVAEFGARSTGEPHHERSVACDAANHLPDLQFPTASPAVMLVERTFWEKATAMHVYCRQQRLRGERRSRHLHDLARLSETDYARAALADRALALAVARHNKMFFPEKDADGNRIDFEAAVQGDLQLVPTGTAYDMLAEDYRQMAATGMLLEEFIPFERIVEQCAVLEARANNL